MNKHYFLFWVLMVVFLLSGCSKDDQISNINNNETGGLLSIRFEKDSCPADVVNISVTLTRNGYSPITRQLDVINSATAELSITNIMPGLWHLKVNALDQGNVVMYTGETDVLIQANAITTANLNLTAATGQLNLKITWGAKSNLSDYPSNPIFGKANSINNPSLGTGSSFILYDENKYKMWYANLYENRKYDVNYAESADGITWTVKCSAPVISVGAGTDWDSYAVYPGAVIKEDGTYKMYYVGVSSQNGDSYVGLATSTNGINWTKNRMPVIMFVDRRMAVNTVLKYNNKYYLYFNYTNLVYGNTGIGLATSADGLSWDVVSENLVLPNQSWESSELLSPCVRYEDNGFKMIYGTASSNGFGLATSTDGITWTKSGNNPIFTPANTGWSSQVRYPYLMKVNNKYRLYYTGYSNGLLSIAFAEGNSL